MSAIKLPKEKACISVLSFPPKKGPVRDAKASDFHKGSFRLVPIPGPKNTKATILVGCPQMEGRAWFPNKGRVIVDRQGIERGIIGSCEFSSGKRKGKGATKGFLKIQKPVAGKCRSGYRLRNFAAFTKGGKTPKKG